MEHPTYHIVYDLLQSGYRGWPFVLVGLLFVAFGLSLVVFKEFGTRVPFQGSKAFRKPLQYFFLIFSVLWTGLVFGGTYHQYSVARALLLQGNTNEVDGRVHDFKPGTNDRGSATESFCVQDKCFKYSDFGSNTGFNNMAINGGPIREGLYVRVRYAGNDILRLEIESSVATTSQKEL